MNRKLSLRRWLCIAAASFAVCHQTTAAQDPTPPAEPVPAGAVQPAADDAKPADAEIGATEVPEEGAAMLRGPVHEAFAEQFSTNPTPSEAIDKAPPEPINEEAPEFQPEGDNIQWIPGYWGWDVEAEDFVWVTGVWRALPPDQQWIPGYWTESAEGWQWISGFWTNSTNEELVYMPTPPESIDAGPSTPAPGDDYFWIPGNWQYNQNQYDWQAGFWSQGHDDWVWIPNRYVWTPSGCLYRDGYWDYAIQSRGTMFCPMTFRSGYNQTFRPRYVVETGPLWLANLFVTPGFHHYCFGNYYPYRGNRAIFPWVNYHQRTRGYDPLFSYYAYQNRNTNLIRQIARVERQIANNPQYRARSTVAAQLRALDGQQGPQANWALRAAQLNSLAADGDLNFDTPFRYAAVDAERRKEITGAVNPARELAQQRRQLEQAETREDRQRAVRADVQADARADKRADVQAENRADARSEKQADKQAENRRDDKPADNKPTENPNAGAASDVKRLAIRADKGANGQRRFDKAEQSKAEPSKAEPGKAEPKKVEPNNNRRDTNPNRNEETRRNQPNTQQPAQQPKANEPIGKEANPNANNPRANSPRTNNPNERARDPLNNSSLDRIHQGLDDKSGPDDARALRDMMKRTPRTNPNAGSPNSSNPNAAAPKPGGRNPNLNPNTNPGAGPDRRPAGNSPAVRPPNLPRQNPAAGARNPNAPAGGGGGNRGAGRPAGNQGGNPGANPGGGKPGGGNPGGGKPGKAG